MSLFSRDQTFDWIASREDMAQFLERYFGWKAARDHNEWDDFENLKLSDPNLEDLRVQILDDLGPINGPLRSDERAYAEEKARRWIAILRPESEC